jgi:hypothetical protein
VPPPPLPPLSRRGVLVGLGGTAGLALTGCGGDREADSGSGTTSGKRSGGVTPDVAVATAALTEIRAVRASVVATAARFPDQRPALTALVGMHRVHEAALVDAVPERARTSVSPAPYAVPRKPARALAAVAGHERHLHAALGDLAVKAQSGEFARLLASMGAAIGQRLAVLDA